MPMINPFGMTLGQNRLLNPVIHPFGMVSPKQRLNLQNHPVQEDFVSARCCHAARIAGPRRMLGDRRLSSVVGVSHQQRSRARLMGDLGPRVARGRCQSRMHVQPRRSATRRSGVLWGRSLIPDEAPCLAVGLGGAGLGPGAPGLEIFACGRKGLGGARVVVHHHPADGAPEAPATARGAFRGLTAPPPSLSGDRPSQAARVAPPQMRERSRPAPWWLPA